ncbi:MAG: hypothetical protein H7833_15915 [Magnetococcus sp. DMHC-1]|nr:hypothetical protein [Magnetococcales bacterium]
MSQLRCLLVGFAACFLVAFASERAVAADASPTPEPVPEQEYLHFGNMGGLLPSLDLGDIKDSESPGAKASLKYCGQCHNHPGPGMHTHEEWNQVFWRMMWRMQIMRAQFKNFLVPHYGESQIMFAYFVANSLKSIKANEVPMQEAGAVDFVKICNQCHQLPSPAQHEVKDWREVVQRMKNHMKSMGRVYPTQEESDRIIAFLKSQSGKK